MSESPRETGEVRDEDLPEDLQPGEDNPLAEPLVDDLEVRGGKSPEHGDGHDGESDGKD